MATKEQIKLIFDRLDYEPSKEQLAVHLAPERIRQVAGGERAGKSYSSANDLLSRVFEGELFWLVGAEYEATKPEFYYIIEGLSKLGVSFQYSKNINPGWITIENAITIETKSAKDPRKLGMQAPDGILACEAAQLDFETFLRLRGRIAEKRGWLLMSGTFEGSLGWYPEKWQRWQAQNDEGAKSFSLPSWSNLKVYPGGRYDPEILALEQDSSEDWFHERYGGVPCPPRGRVFTEFQVSIHTGSGENFDYLPSEPVHVWIDPGFDHAYAVLFAQKRGDEIYIIDEVYEKGLITEDIITICQQKPCWRNIESAAIDIGGTQHHGMPAVIDIWHKEAGILPRYEKVPILDGIERVKSLLKVNPLTGHPKLYINTKCKGLISEFGGVPNPFTGQPLVYKWKRDREGNIVGNVPDDKNNDAVKALTYGLVSLLGYVQRNSGNKIKVSHF